mmetsp:Transcript_4921/g.10196  ORF Transcript_4921/g.10196 Transcript_4921/m.10196 type:complete len:225 (+) Transcript_4921:71-745(+)
MPPVLKRLKNPNLANLGLSHEKHFGLCLRGNERSCFSRERRNDGIRLAVRQILTLNRCKYEVNTRLGRGVKVSGDANEVASSNILAVRNLGNVGGHVVEVKHVGVDRNAQVAHWKLKRVAERGMHSERLGVSTLRGTGNNRLRSLKVNGRGSHVENSLVKIVLASIRRCNRNELDEDIAKVMLQVRASINKERKADETSLDKNLLRGLENSLDVGTVVGLESCG